LEICACPGPDCRVCPRGSGRWQAFAINEEELIAEYEELRRLAHELDEQSETIEERPIEIEEQLPDEYTYPGDNIPLEQ
jgi:hypothetical protein